jgi:hypothetical protein
MLEPPVSLHPTRLLRHRRSRTRYPRETSSTYSDLGSLIALSVRKPSSPRYRRSSTPTSHQIVATRCSCAAGQGYCRSAVAAPTATVKAPRTTSSTLCPLRAPGSRWLGRDLVPDSDPLDVHGLSMKGYLQPMSTLGMPCSRPQVSLYGTCLPRERLSQLPGERKVLGDRCFRTRRASWLMSRTPFSFESRLSSSFPGRYDGQDWRTKARSGRSNSASSQPLSKVSGQN